MGRAAALLALLLLAGCAPAANPVPARSPTPAPRLSPVPSPSTPVLKAPAAINFTRSAAATGLVAPWAVDFTSDGTAWLTERPGRVRVIRGGKLLPDPALTLSVLNQSGCEGGLLGIAVKEPYVYLDYSPGGFDRVSRFRIQNDHLVSEQVLLDNIPAGTCYHFGGRLRFGPDGWLYISTGEGFVAARAADPNNRSGKILRIHEDGTGPEIYAWGFRNPQGLAFDAAGRLYASSNGPTGEFGLCCHDEVDQVSQGAFYGWPAWAAGVRTSYPQGSLPARTGPMVESGNDTWAPSGITFYSPRDDERETLFVAELRGQALRRLVIDPARPDAVTSQEIVLSGAGRLRDVVAAPDRCLWVLTSNRDSRGSPQAGDDQVIRLCT
ncbi:MAG: PQQ-dependent sugar dehydrogenase [Candidatus Dormibacteraeota bacterium]|nr:PQQ-dependent sugar dehydrogenase [Candidatus Dormibacteraeota bacterium]